MSAVVPKNGRPPKAYLDSFGGLVPCEVIASWHAPLAAWCPQVILRKVRLRVTEKVGGYDKGMEIETDAYRAIPPDKVNRGGMFIKITSVEWGIFALD